LGLRIGKYPAEGAKWVKGVKGAIEAKGQKGYFACRA